MIALPLPIDDGPVFMLRHRRPIMPVDAISIFVYRCAATFTHRARNTDRTHSFHRSTSFQMRRVLGQFIGKSVPQHSHSTQCQIGLHRQCLDCIRHMRLLTPNWTRWVEKGSNNHDYETKEHKPEPCSQMRWNTKASKDSPEVTYHKLNG